MDHNKKTCVYCKKEKKTKYERLIDRAQAYEQRAHEHRNHILALEKKIARLLVQARALRKEAIDLNLKEGGADADND